MMKGRSRPRRFWWNLLAAAGADLLMILAGLMLGVSYLVERAFVHPYRFAPPSGEYLQANHIEFQDVEITTSDGVRLAAWYTPPRNGVVILMAHGFHAGRSEALYTMFAGTGYGALAWDFRGHAASGGDTVTLGLDEQRDVQAALDFALAQLGVEHIGAWGGSMGAAALVLTAAYRPEIEALVIDSCFPSLDDVFALNIPVPVIRPLTLGIMQLETGLSPARVRPEQAIGRISPRPVFIIQGGADALAIVNASGRLYAAAGEPRLLWTEPGVPHLGMFAFYPDEYTRRVLSFFDEYLRRVK